MNHPKREDWVPYLYGEGRPEVRQQLREHLHECAECRDELEAWKRSLGRLDAWKLPRANSPLQIAAPFLRWAAAAAMVLVVGFGVGRLTARQAGVEQLRTRLESQIRQDLRQEFAQMLQKELSNASALTLARAQRQAEDIAALYYASLKKDLDTVAVNTDVSLRQAQQELVQLADYGPSEGAPKLNNQ